MTFKLLSFFAAFGILILSGACQSQAQPSNPTPSAAADWQNVDVPTFKKLMAAPNTVVLDVRTPAETAQNKIAGAVEIDYNSPNFPEKIAQLDKSKTYLVYCRSGNRSGKACDIMQQEGFGKLYNLQGGMLVWKE